MLTLFWTIFTLQYLSSESLNRLSEHALQSVDLMTKMTIANGILCRRHRSALFWLNWALLHRIGVNSTKLISCKVASMGSHRIGKQIKAERTQGEWIANYVEPHTSFPMVLLSTMQIVARSERNRWSISPIMNAAEDLMSNTMTSVIEFPWNIIITYCIDTNISPVNNLNAPVLIMMMA